MKTLIILLMPILCISCRTVKDLRAEQQQNYTMARKQSHKQSILYDSLHHHWYFATDSVFYFHPNVGLYASSGILGAVTEQKRSLLMSKTADSLRFTSQSMLSERNTSLQKSGNVYWTMLIMLALVAMVFGFCLIRK